MLDRAPSAAGFGALFALYAVCLAAGFGLKGAARSIGPGSRRPDPGVAKGPGIATKFKAFFLFQAVLMSLAFWSLPALSVFFLILFLFSAREILLLRRRVVYPVGYGFRPLPAFGLLILSGLSLAGYAGFGWEVQGGTGESALAGGSPFLAFVFLLIAVADGYAQITGQILGGPKIVPRISPGKTWSGFFGSLFFCGLVCWCGEHYLFGFLRGSAAARFPHILPAVFGVFVGSLAFLGDISASWVKRRMGLKDFSNLLGPQGGILDRIDSLLWLGPALWIAVSIKAAIP